MLVSCIKKSNSMMVYKDLNMPASDMKLKKIQFFKTYESIKNSNVFMNS